ncbi:NUDIX hydrolase [Kurthia senegalensis]|uniref:NUDIX hydrolase n=1 Tax=Kurthia senegalensis TaxID=1033740 RepID=UPI000289DF6D|nr:NUDIX hydrolase [Kurthia senegalensis]
MEPKWLTYAKQLQAIAQAGIAYSKDVYDLERFEQIRELSVDILAHYTELEHHTLRELFANETGYATPKVDVRATVFSEGKILLVREKQDGLWALPGGWADIGQTMSEVAVKEVREESGLLVRPEKLIAVLDKQKHPHPPSAYSVYKLFIQCFVTGGTIQKGLETSDVQFFEEANIPALSLARNTASQITMAFDHFRNPERPTQFD